MKKQLLMLLAVMCCLSNIKADEGMWMLSHVSPKSMKIMKGKKEAILSYGQFMQQGFNGASGKSLS